ncbi:MAG TPA: holo-ACP synthase [Acidobacteriota bacterium]|jgi:holo-[acyl-carrier protein] synthase|nr:holo-ACP synthase [Acidobacteriota bacterium]
MIIGVGVDIVEIRRISQALTGSRSMPKRVFTEEEINYCGRRKTQFQHYAGRFAAKEATLKALGTGWQGGIRWTDVEVRATNNGKPELRLYGKARELFEASGAKRALLSITHSKEYAVAVVILED